MLGGYALSAHRPADREGRVTQRRTVLQAPQPLEHRSACRARKRARAAGQADARAAAGTRPRRGPYTHARTQTQQARARARACTRVRARTGGLIDHMRQGSIVGSVGAGQPDRPDSRGRGPALPTTSHLGPCSRRTFRRTRRTNQMCSTNSLHLRRRHHRLPGIHRHPHSDRRAATLRGSGPLSGPVAGRP